MDKNQKHPKIDLEGEYPYVHVDTGADGHQVIRSLYPDKETVFYVEPTGNYEGHSRDGDKVSVNVGKAYDYSADGTSKTVDGHADTKVSGTSRTNVALSTSAETGSDENKGIGGNVIEASRGSKIQASTQGDNFQKTKGNIVTSHEGDKHEEIRGDQVVSVTGHKVDLVNGEFAVHVPSGNMDVRVDSGKYRLKAGSDILIESSSSITIKVGSSTIVVQDGMITITTGNVAFVKS
jgi:type VI secretion system secreted protein VgrG